MKTKILILTLIGEENFGNKLQNYAIQEKISINDKKIFSLRLLSRPYFTSLLKWHFIRCFINIVPNDNLKVRCSRRFQFFAFNTYIKQVSPTLFFRIPSKVKKKLTSYDKIIYSSD